MGKLGLTQREIFGDIEIETLEPEGETGDLDLRGLEELEG